MGKKRRDGETSDVSKGDGDASDRSARWIGNVNSAPERRQSADAEATEFDAVEEVETYDGGKTAGSDDPGR
ncbi:hypothetical protein [Streptomyces sp. NPDC057302]|uniref:hypothetical protein n=1 Tax=Streptomyces sp. NPDC057302 TaxID=3346094 RepID=UPI00362A09E2